MFKKIDNYFTDKRKGTAAVGALVFALIFAILWKAMPMEFYSIFFANTAGSYVLLAMINAVVLLPFFWIFTKLSKTDLSFCKAVLMNIILVMAVEFVCSVFFFSDYIYWCIAAIIVHILINIWTFGSAKIRDGKAPKGMNAPAPEKVAAIKKQPIIPIVWAAAYSFAVDIAGFLLFYTMARIFSY